jgi:class 3 adenylate cyclase
MRAFFDAIDRYAEAGVDERRRIDADIWARYGVTRAVLALDMAEFSIAVRRDGVLSYLCRIRRMHAVTAPVVQAHGGEVIRFEADNLLAGFPDPNQALRAAIRIRRLMNEDALAQPVSIGLAHGRILLIPDADAHGDAVNTAFKLGEDVALSNEILASRDFVDALDPQHGCALEAQDIHIAGLRLDAFRVHA